MYKLCILFANGTARDYTVDDPTTEVVGINEIHIEESDGTPHQLNWGQILDITVQTVQ